MKQVSNNTDIYRARLRTCAILPMTFPLRGYSTHHLQCILRPSFLGIDITRSGWIHAPISFISYILYTDIILHLVILDYVFHSEIFHVRIHRYISFIYMCIYHTQTYNTPIAYTFIFVQKTLSYIYDSAIGFSDSRKLSTYIAPSSLLTAAPSSSLWMCQN